MPNDQEFEIFLRRFQPLAPAPLPRAPQRRSRRSVWLAVAALLLLAAGLWLRQRRVPPAVTTTAAGTTGARATWGALRATALADPAALEAELEHQARQSLPDVSRRGGALRSLAEFQKDL